MVAHEVFHKASSHQIINLWRFTDKYKIPWNLPNNFHPDLTATVGGSFSAKVPKSSTEVCKVFLHHIVIIEGVGQLGTTGWSERWWGKSENESRSRKDQEQHSQQNDTCACNVGWMRTWALSALEPLQGANIWTKKNSQGHMNKEKQSRDADTDNEEEWWQKQRSSAVSQSTAPTNHWMSSWVSTWLSSFYMLLGLSLCDEFTCSMHQTCSLSDLYGTSLKRFTLRTWTCEVLFVLKKTDLENVQHTACDANDTRNRADVVFDKLEREWILSRRVKFDSGFNVTVVYEASKHGRKIVNCFTGIPKWVARWWKRPFWFSKALFKLDVPVIRWMISIILDPKINMPFP